LVVLFWQLVVPRQPNLTKAKKVLGDEIKFSEIFYNEAHGNPAGDRSVPGLYNMIENEPTVLNAKFNLKADAKAVANAQAVTIAFKIETEDGDATDTQLLATELEGTFHDETEETPATKHAIVWDFAHNNEFAELYSQIVNNGEATLLSKFLAGKVASDAGYTGFSGDPRGEVNADATYKATTLEFRAEKAGTYKVTAYMIDLSETETTNADGNKTTEQKGTVLKQQTITFKVAEKSTSTPQA